MKNNQIQDERILLERRKIQSTAYTWLVTILLASVVVQQSFMNAPFVQYAVEFFILIGCGLYNIISNLKKGIDIWNPSGVKKKKILLNTILSGIISVIVFVFLSGEDSVVDLIQYFVTFIVFFFILRIVMTKITEKKQLRIEKKLNKDDDELNK